MSIGNQTQNTPGQLNSQLGQLAVQLRDNCAAILAFFENVSNLGVAGLETLGFASADATNYYNAANYLQTVASVYYGTAAQTPAFDFDAQADLVMARGGQ